VIRPQQGTETARISPRRVREAQFVRELFEHSALCMAAQRGARGLSPLQHQLVVQERAVERYDFGAFFDPDKLFHRRRSVLSGFDGLGRIANAARVHLDRFRALSLPEPTTSAADGRRARGHLEALGAGRQRGRGRDAPLAPAERAPRAPAIVHHPEYVADKDGPFIELVDLKVALRRVG